MGHHRLLGLGFYIHACASVNHHRTFLNRKTTQTRATNFHSLRKQIHRNSGRKRQINNKMVAESVVSSHNQPGHSLTLHPLVSLATPWQGFPLFAGAGFVHLRLRVWRSPPHVLQQGTHEDQADQLPSTKQRFKQQCELIHPITNQLRSCLQMFCECFNSWLQSDNHYQRTLSLKLKFYVHCIQTWA